MASRNFHYLRIVGVAASSSANVYVMERILGITPMPPPNIPGVEPDIRGTATLRELLDKHRNQLCFLSQQD